jgi:YidC/Oxa1 family membrane protein insertase
VPAIPAHGETTIAGNFYVGPKEYPRLSNMDVFHKDEDRVMDFGNFVFRFCAALLLTVMTWFHSWTANWGIAIILTTLARSSSCSCRSPSRSRAPRGGRRR